MRVYFQGMTSSTVTGDPGVLLVHVQRPVGKESAPVFARVPAPPHQMADWTAWAATLMNMTATLERVQVSAYSLWEIWFAPDGLRYGAMYLHYMA